MFGTLSKYDIPIDLLFKRRYTLSKNGFWENAINNKQIFMIRYFFLQSICNERKL